MNTYISMLRGINVSGQKIIKMRELVFLYESLNFKNVKTYVQSGNVIFDSPVSNASKLSHLIEEMIKKVFGFSVIVLIRTYDELQQIIDNNPFLKNKKINASKLYLTFLSNIPDETASSQLQSLKDKTDDFKIADKEIYLFCPNGYGRTKLSNNFFEKKLNVSATTRNWKTVNMLLDTAKG